MAPAEAKLDGRRGAAGLTALLDTLAARSWHVRVAVSMRVVGLRATSNHAAGTGSFGQLSSLRLVTLLRVLIDLPTTTFAYCLLESGHVGAALWSEGLFLYRKAYSGHSHPRRERWHLGRTKALLMGQPLKGLALLPMSHLLDRRGC